jgi:hypothetical protein
VVLWDSITGQWWFGLTVEDFTARGYRLVWERKTELASPRLALYRWTRLPLTRPFRQALLVKD